MSEFKEGDIAWFITDFNEIESRMICNIDRSPQGTVEDFCTVTLYHHRRPFIGDLNLCERRIRDIFHTKNEAIDAIISDFEAMKDD